MLKDALNTGPGGIVDRARMRAKMLGDVHKTKANQLLTEQEK